MIHVSFRLYAQLNRHVSADRRQVCFRDVLEDDATIGRACEALRIPTEEIELILLNGEVVSPAHLLNEDDRVSLYPQFCSIDVAPLSGGIKDPLPSVRFVLDVHLGKLAHHLRMLGFDVIYRNDSSPRELLAIAQGEERMLLSMSKSLIEDKAGARGYRVRSYDPREQLIDIMGRFNLRGATHPFQRCLRCNALLQPVAKEEIRNQLPERVRDLYREFMFCAGCGKIYWQGTHAVRMKEFIEGLFAP